MDDKTHKVTSLLIDLEAQLRQTQRWSDLSPSEEALASEQPFCVDTLSFDQWLQFIFLPRLHALIEQGAALPTECAIAPMAEETYQAQGTESRVLIAVIKQIDEVLSA